MTNQFRIHNCTSQALLELYGHGPWEDWLVVVRDEDVCVLNERALAEEEEAQADHLDELSQVITGPAGIAVAQGLAVGEGFHTLSWIWYSTVDSSMGKDNPKLHEALRVEWSEKWDCLVSAILPDSNPELTEGCQVYAAEKADQEHNTCTKLRRDWAGILVKVDVYLEGCMPMQIGEVTVPLNLGDKLDPEDEEALLEGDDE
ncbi:hypothetical protein B0H14DRAFT_3452348 [Mycena olivaceomarginata]|nr:hypothetical protein B0H14DRAFT_3452348 [Mycena olivaceomarginata]